MDHYSIIQTNFEGHSYNQWRSNCKPEKPKNAMKGHIYMLSRVIALIFQTQRQEIWKVCVCYISNLSLKLLISCSYLPLYNMNHTTKITQSHIRKH